MGQVVRLTEQTTKTVAQLTKWLPDENMSRRIDFIVKDYIRLKQVCQKIAAKESMISEIFTTGLQCSLIQA